MHSRNSFTGPRRVYASMFGDTTSGEVKRDGAGQVITDFSAVEVSDPTTFGMWRLGNPEEIVYMLSGLDTVALTPLVTTEMKCSLDEVYAEPLMKAS